MIDNLSVAVYAFAAYDDITFCRLDITAKV